MTTQLDAAFVDVGNVIINHEKTTPELVSHGDYNTIPEVIGAMEGLEELNRLVHGNITLSYKATDTADGKILNWLTTYKLTERTGIPLRRAVRFDDGGDRNNRDKTTLMTLSPATHPDKIIVIDDRLQVLSHFIGKASHLFLFNPQAQEIEDYRHTGALAHVHVVKTWTEILEILKKFLRT